MAPAAVTSAGRAASNKRKSTATSPAAATSVPGHRRRLGKPASPKPPRRVSGPIRGRAATPAPPPRAQTGTAPRARSGTAPSRVRTAGRATGRPLGARALAAVGSLPDHPLLDRLIRGRAWIPLLGVLLAGIVTMQVEVLKLGTGIGRSIERSAELQTRNDQLRMSVAALDADQRIERIAAASGMIMPAPDAVGFLSSHRGGLVSRAISNIHAPDASTFQAYTGSNGAIATVASSLAAASGSSASGSTPSTASLSSSSSSTAATQTAASSSSAQATTSDSGASSASTPATSQTTPANSTATSSGSGQSTGQTTGQSTGQTTGQTTGQSTSQSAGATVSPAPAQTGSSQSSTSSSGGAGIPVGG